MPKQNKFPSDGFFSAGWNSEPPISKKENDQDTVQIGYINKNWQVCLGSRGKRGTDHNNLAYALFCLCCGNLYGANGSDVHKRLCPNIECQEGHGEALSF